MYVSKKIAKHFREIYFGGNWTCSNFKDNLSDLTWQQATARVHSFNTIATLVYHTNYYVEEVLKVLEGQSLNAKDADSFKHPEIYSKEDWESFLKKVWQNGKNFANRLENLSETKIWENFSEEKYGTYYRNLHGIIEHSHYHLGQIALIKKIIIEQNGTTSASVKRP